MADRTVAQTFGMTDRGPLKISKFIAINCTQQKCDACPGTFADSMDIHRYACECACHSA